MAQVRLQRPGVGALVRQRITRRMAQHVRVDLEGHLGTAMAAKLQFYSRGSLLPNA
jgi:hypothetical protein